MVWFNALRDQFVRCFDRANVSATFEFDAVRFLDLSARIFIDEFDKILDRLYQIIPS